MDLTGCRLAPIDTPPQSTTSSGMSAVFFPNEQQPHPGNVHPGRSKRNNSEKCCTTSWLRAGAQSRRDQAGVRGCERTISKLSRGCPRNGVEGVSRGTTGSLPCCRGRVKGFVPADPHTCSLLEEAKSVQFMSRKPSGTKDEKRTQAENCVAWCNHGCKNPPNHYGLATPIQAIRTCLPFSSNFEPQVPVSGESHLHVPI